MVSHYIMWSRIPAKSCPVTAMSSFRMSLVHGGLFLCATFLPLDPFQCEDHFWRAGARRTDIEPAATHDLSSFYIQTGKPNQNANIGLFSQLIRHEILRASLFRILSEVRGLA